jgi:hypothetical protein
MNNASNPGIIPVKNITLHPISMNDCPGNTASASPYANDAITNPKEYPLCTSIES